MSDCTAESENFRPIKRFASNTVFVGFMATWFFAASPIDAGHVAMLGLEPFTQPVDLVAGVAEDHGRTSQDDLANKTEREAFGKVAVWYYMMVNVRVQLHHLRRGDSTNIVHVLEGVACPPPFSTLAARAKWAGENTIRAAKGQQIMLLPELFREDDQNREVLYINGASGMGKSWLINSFAKIYHVYYPENKIYFLTMNDFEADRSLDHSLYTKVDMNQFLEQMDSKSESGETGLEEFSKSHETHNCFSSLTISVS